MLPPGGFAAAFEGGPATFRRFGTWRPPHRHSDSCWLGMIRAVAIARRRPVKPHQVRSPPKAESRADQVKAFVEPIAGGAMSSA
jgi:hypothetical protein